MAEYFGNNSDGDNSGAFIYAYLLTAGYVCPGSGAVDVVSLDINASTDGGYVRGAIYKQSDGSFVMQWSARQTPGGAGWIVLTTFTDQAGDPIVSPQLVSGTQYLLVAGGSGTAEVYWTAVSSGVGLIDWNGANYVDSGFPAALDTANSTRSPSIRCSVESAAGGTAGTIIPHLIYRAFMARN